MEAAPQLVTADELCRELTELHQRRQRRWTRRDWHLFYSLWDKAVGKPDYNKTQWKELEALIQRLEEFHA